MRPFTKRPFSSISLQAGWLAGKLLWKGQFVPNWYFHFGNCSGMSYTCIHRIKLFSELRLKIIVNQITRRRPDHQEVSESTAATACAKMVASNTIYYRTLHISTPHKTWWELTVCNWNHITSDWASKLMPYFDKTKFSPIICQNCLSWEYLILLIKSSSHYVGSSCTPKFMRPSSEARLWKLKKYFQT